MEQHDPPIIPRIDINLNETPMPASLVAAVFAALVIFAASVAVTALTRDAIEREANEPHRECSSLEECMVLEDEAEAAGLDVMSERGAVITMAKNTATKVSCGGTSAHMSWICKARTPASVIYRGGSNVGTDGGTGSVWCDGTALDDCIDDVISGDTAHAYLYTRVDAGVVLGCSCAYK